MITFPAFLCFKSCSQCSVELRLLIGTLTKRKYILVIIKAEISNICFLDLMCCCFLSFMIVMKGLCSQTLGQRKEAI